MNCSPPGHELTAMTLVVGIEVAGTTVNGVGNLEVTRRLMNDEKKFLELPTLEVWRMVLSGTRSWVSRRL
jgi:hypothetical protein